MSVKSELVAIGNQIQNAGQARDALSKALDWMVTRAPIDKLGLAAVSAKESLEAQINYSNRIRKEFDSLYDNEALPEINLRKVQLSLKQTGSVIDLIIEQANEPGLADELVNSLKSTISATVKGAIETAQKITSIVPWYVWAGAGLFLALLIYLRTKA